jgi:hypothetical protein
MKGDTIWRLEFLALTPVHIGDGSVWDPGNYLIERPRRLEEWEKDEMDDEEIEAFESARNPPRLHRIDFGGLLMRAGDPARRRILGHLDRGDWKSAVGDIAKIAKPTDYLETIELGDEALAEAIERSRTDPRRYGEIHGFVRSGGHLVVPGSSLKGGLRTAWLAHVLEGQPDLVRELRAALERSRKQVLDPSERTDGRLQTAKISDLLETRALLGTEKRITDKDPFRYLSVPDVELPAGVTTIRRVLNHVPLANRNGKPRQNDLNMFYEFVRSWADGDPVRWEAEVRIDSPAAQERRQRLAPTKAPDRLDAGLLWDAVRSFGLGLWKEERCWFWNAEPETKSLLDQAEKKFCIEADASCALLRIGRFAHCDSKSVPPLRISRHHRQPTEFRDREATRMVVRRGSTLVPIGWVLVWLRDVRSI